MPRRQQSKKKTKKTRADPAALPEPREGDTMRAYLARAGFTRKEAAAWPGSHPHLPEWLEPRMVWACHARQPAPLRRARLSPRSRFWAQLARFLRTNDFSEGRDSLAHQFQLFAGGEFHKNQHKREYKLARAWEAVQTDLVRSLKEVADQITHVDVDMPQRRAVAAAMGVYRQMRECMVRTQDLASKMESTPEPRPYHSLAVRLRAQKSRLRQLERRCKAQFASLPGKHVAIARVLGATAEKSGAAPAQRFLVAWTRRHPLGEMHAHWNAAKDALLEHAPPINTSVENVALAGGGAMDARRIRAQRAYERAFHAGLRRRHAA